MQQLVEAADGDGQVVMLETAHDVRYHGVKDGVKVEADSDGDDDDMW